MEEDNSTPEPGKEVKKEPTMIDLANESAERLEKANSDRLELLKREEELMARKMFGGKTDSGSVEQEPPKELSPKEYRAKIEKELAEGKFND